LTSLKELSLYSSGIGTGAAKLAEEIKKLKSLEKLDLRGNQIRDEEKSRLRKLTGIKYLWV